MLNNKCVVFVYLQNTHMEVPAGMLELLHAGLFGFTRNEGASLFDHVAKTISQNWRSAFAKYKVSEADAERFQHTFSAFGDDDV